MHDAYDQGEIAGLRAQVKDLQSLNEKLSTQLQERTKELLFHQKIFALFETPSKTLEQIYQHVVDLLPQAFQDPEHLVAFLQVFGVEYGNPEVRHAHASLSVDLNDGGHIIGTISVACAGGTEPTGPTVFLDEEKSLLTLLAQRLVEHTFREKEKLSPFQEWNAYRELYDSLHEVLFEVSTDGRIVFASTASKEMLGYDPSELIDKPLSQFIHPEDIPKLYSSLETINLEAASVLEFRLHTSNGLYKWCRSSAFTVM